MFIPNFVKNDPLLEKYSYTIFKRHRDAVQKEHELKGSGTLSEFASGYMYFGLFKTDDSWIFREWAPNANEMYLVGDFNGWKIDENFCCKKKDNGVFELILPLKKLKHKDKYRLFLRWNGGEGYRIPAWTRRAIQDIDTLVFDAQVWSPNKNYEWKHKAKLHRKDQLIIYEAHVGIATPEERVGTYKEFTKNVLPRIKKAGYNAIQLMAIQEHPYYGSFGYHVSSLFATSSRFGTPEELKELVDTAHKMGILVIMDIIHSHAVKNEIEGLSLYDGTDNLFFHKGERGNHPAWDSRCYDYGKDEVIHFLLSNLKYYIEEFRFDGFRFDGITSMLYTHHGLNRDFTEYSMYFDDTFDKDAYIYLYLANKLSQELNPNIITIAEEMSGMPGVAVDCEDGGLGFNFRLAMGVPDYWIKTIKEKKDEEWHLGDMFYELCSRRNDEHTIGYVESHDQAIVGDKTVIFRLADKDMYQHMGVKDKNLAVDRGISLINMIKLITSTTAGSGYLNFMGNEFGHPEWIDFPREGNNWSYKHAVRQWYLADDKSLKYYKIGYFDKDMVKLLKKSNIYSLPYPDKIYEHLEKQIIVYERNGYLFAFNFNPEKSFTDIIFEAPAGSYKIILDTDQNKYSGQGRIDNKIKYLTNYELATQKNYLSLYLPARTGLVLEKID